MKIYAVSRQFICGLVAFAALNAVAGTGSSSKLLDVSGLNAQLDQLAPFIEQIVMQKVVLDPSINNEKKEEFRLAIRHSYDSDIYKKHLAANIEKSLSKEAADEIILLYKDPVVAKQTIKEQTEMSQPDVFEKVTGYAIGLAKKPPSEKRLKLAAELFEKLHTIEMQVKIFKASTIPMIKTFAEDTPGFSEETLNKDIERMAESMRTSMQRQTMIAFLYGVRDMNDAQVEKYVGKFKKSKHLQELIAIFEKSVIDDLSVSASSIGRGIKKLKE